MNYRQSVEFIDSLRIKRANYTLKNIRTLLFLLGNPEKRLKFIHVAGSNGKGSVCAMVYSIMLDAGYRVGMNISPHLVKYNERIQYRGKNISDKDFAKCATEVRKAMERAPGFNPTFFEFLTAMALHFFAKKRVKWVVLEVGMGGKHDATNVVKSKAQVVTNVDREHMKTLGKNLRKIALQKAGIIKKNSVVVTATEKKRVLDVIKRKCREKGSRLVLVGKDVKFERDGFTLKKQFFDYFGAKWKLRKATISLFGAHQVINAATALAVVEALGLKKVNKRIARQGLAKAKWPGRFEVYRKKPFIVFDAAHNPGAFRRLKNSLKELNGHYKIKMVMGTSGDKDYKSMAANIAPLVDSVVVCQAQHRGLKPKLLRGEFKKFTPHVKVIKDCGKAFKYALEHLKKDEMLLVAGSIFVVGEVKKALKNGG